MAVSGSGYEDPPGLDWADVDLRKHLPAVGFGQLAIWDRAVAQQAVRLETSTGTDMGVQADAYLFAQALRQVLRAAELVADGLTGDPRKQSVETAIREFNAIVPHAKDARDVLDHFDDYVRGMGQLSHPAARNTRDRNGAASAAASREYRISPRRDESGDCILQLGPISVDTREAKAASKQLASKVLAVWWKPAEESEVDDLFSDLGPDSPMFPVLLLLAILEGDAPEELLDRVVTPESLRLWHLDELREVTSGYGLASRIAYGAEDVAYVKLVKGGPDYLTVVREATLVEAQILTIQRRADLGGEWRIHQLGEAASPKQLPRPLSARIARNFQRAVGRMVNVMSDGLSTQERPDG